MWCRIACSISEALARSETWRPTWSANLHIADDPRIADLDGSHATVLDDDARCAHPFGQKHERIAVPASSRWLRHGKSLGHGAERSPRQVVQLEHAARLVRQGRKAGIQLREGPRPLVPIRQAVLPCLRTSHRGRTQQQRGRHGIGGLGDIVREVGIRRLPRVDGPGEIAAGLERIDPALDDAPASLVEGASHARHGPLHGEVHEVAREAVKRDAQRRVESASARGGFDPLCGRFPLVTHAEPTSRRGSPMPRLTLVRSHSR